MAQKIVVGLSTYLESFVTGQSGLRVGNYTQYSTDLDTDFVTLRVTVNQIIDELAALGAPTATLGLDTMIFNDPARGGGPLADGLIGLHSFLTTIGAPTSELDVQGGDVVVSSVKISNVGGTTFTGSGGAGTRWVAIDVNGTLFQETSAAQRALDLYSAVWDGAAFTSTTRLAEVFFDGDEYEGMRDRPAVGTTPATFPALSFAQFNHRMQAVEAVLAGLSTDAQSNALGQPAIRAGSAAAPGLVVIGSTNTGIYGSTTTLSIATSGVVRLTVSTVSITPTVPILAPLGTAALPSYAMTGDTNTGIWSPGGDRLAGSTAGAQAFEFDARGNLDLPLQARVSGSTLAQVITTSTATLIDFDEADNYDLPNGEWHDAASGTLSDRQEFTCPTNCDGGYLLLVHFDFGDIGAANKIRRVDILLNTSVIGDGLETFSQGVYQASFSVIGELVATDTITVEVFHDKGSDQNIDVRLQLIKLW